MKTLNDLVDKLNNYVELECGELGEYYIDQPGYGADYGDKRYYLYRQYYAPDDGLLATFSPDFPRWIINFDFGYVNTEVQKVILDFIYTTDSNHWFDEPKKKYNIRMVKDLDPDHYA